MVYLHSADLIHRDLKSMNIMIGDKMRGKVADYGESREKAANSTMTSVGTPLWMAPEVSSGKRYDSKADVFSFGIILHEVLKQDLPYSDKPEISGIGLAVSVAMKGLRPTMDEGWHPALKALLKDCYEAVPSSRPTFSEVVLRLRSVIDEMSAGEKAEVAGGTDAEHTARSMDSNLLGLGLWRAIRTDFFNVLQGERIGGVSSNCARGGFVTSTRPSLCNCTSSVTPSVSNVKGATADVYRGMYLNQPVALKVFRQLEASKARKEIELVFELRHPNIVGIFAFFQFPETGKVGIVFELCSEGNLSAAYKKDWFTDAIGLKILWGCARALSYMHSFPVPIVHRDLKSTNILITEERVGKVRVSVFVFVHV